MQVLERLEDYPRGGGRPVVTIGNFDGVHVGHRSLLARAQALARSTGGPVLAVTFDPHPLAILAPEKAPARLTTLEQRIALLGLAGADTVIALRTDRALLGLTADEFMRKLVDACAPSAVVEGPEFQFGKDRAGSGETVRRWAGQVGFHFEMAQEVFAPGVSPPVPVHSSTIRRQISQGQVEMAAVLLGRRHQAGGIVVAGDARGRSIGFPTANLADIPQLLPLAGVYAAVAELADGRLFLCAVNIGGQPTFDQSGARVEAHLIDFEGELRGARLGLHLCARLRAVMKFSSVDELRAQIAADVASVSRKPEALERIAAQPRIPI